MMIMRKWVVSQILLRRGFSSFQKVPDSMWSAAKEMKTTHDKVSIALQEPTLELDERIKLGKELGRLHNVADIVETMQKNLVSMQELGELKKDKDIEMKEMAAIEYDNVMNEMEKLEDNLLREFVVTDEDDSRNAILEIRAGVGGVEAAIFAFDLYRMYERYCTSQGMRFQQLDIQMTDGMNGCKDAHALVSGDNVFGILKHEVGGHRVQRIPITETKGKIHTSAVIVTVMPEVENVDVVVNEAKDLRIDTYRSSGPGGQHVNTTDSAVRITHIPTGLQVAIQCERAQLLNKNKALKILYSKLYKLEKQRLDAERKALYGSVVSSGDRSERIRTYNYAQGRITDHRLNKSVFGIDKFMSGDGLNEFLDDLHQQEKDEALERLLDSMTKKE